nr:MAG TPA: hypothetical protein [Caudoviricetes sp.]
MARKAWIGSKSLSEGFKNVGCKKFSYSYDIVRYYKQIYCMFRRVL